MFYAEAIACNKYLRPTAVGSSEAPKVGESVEKYDGAYAENRRITLAMTCKATTLKMKTTERVMTTTGSTLSPGDSSVYSLSIVLELPPAPAALVLLGLRFAVFSARSAAAFLLMTVAGPPGGLGEAGRAVVEPEEAWLAGELARGADIVTSDELTVGYRRVQ